MRVVIVGVGGAGAMAAWRLAQAGHEVVALEQFEIDHDKGSSYGDSRVVRRVYPDPLYTALMEDAYPLWEELQSHFPTTELYAQTGGIYFASKGISLLTDAREALAASKVAHEILDISEATQRFPAFTFQLDEAVLYEPSMGYLRTSRCVAAAVALARSHGADIQENVSIAAIDTDTNGVRVTLENGEEFAADSLLLCAGAWTGPLLAKLGIDVPYPVTITRQTYHHLAVPEANAADYAPKRFPVWIDASTNFYGLPALDEVPGIKISLHEHGEPATPEAVERSITDADTEKVLRYAAHRFPALSGKVTYEKVCLYANTPDEDFIIDSVPGMTHTFVVSACSGHGFKFVPLVGQIAADLATGNALPYDLSRFRLARFAA